MDDVSDAARSCAADAWGKLGADGARRSLIQHCLDVAACFDALLRQPLFRARVAAAMGRPHDGVTAARLGAIVMLHDVGKLNAGFQLKVETGSPLRRLGNVGHVGEGRRLLCGAGALDAEELSALTPIRQALGLSDLQVWGAGLVACQCAALAHHGRPVADGTGVKHAAIWRAQAGYDPVAAAQRFGAALRAAFPTAFETGPDLPQTPAAQHLFCGLVALADQIGSREDFFPPGGPPLQGEALAERAAQALAAIGLDASKARAGRRDPTPEALFGWEPGDALKPMQAALRDAPVDRRLLILEAETGSGKTEAAFLRFRTLFEARAVDALYFAVPTRAAATQLHCRINDAAQRLLGVEAVLALPGYCKAGEAGGRPMPEWRIAWDDDPDQARRDARWAAETPRRYLASLVAVGTVDQAMLAALQTKWAHFRAAALSRSLLVVDEVHASDAYMAPIIARLLGDHVGLGGHALLMSATLGSAARRKWLIGGLRPAPDAAVATPYPALSWAEGRVERVEALTHDGRSKTVAVAANPVMADAAAVAGLAQAHARAGARTLVIRNTVALAVETVRAIEAIDPDAPLLRVNGVRAPHHSRFAAEDRKALDAAVEAALGKGSKAPCIVVGTQTVEQSLDIDADVLLTDLCPVDVLLQRIGRLHRHPDRARPAGYAAASCIILTPERLAPGLGLERLGLGTFPEGGGVYENLVALEATRRLIANAPVWTIPADNRRLVEAATHPDLLDALSADLGPAWDAAHLGAIGRDGARHGQGSRGLVRRDAQFNGPDVIFSDEEKILTRLGEDRAMVTLPDGTTGPFDAPVVSLSLSARMLAGLEDWTALETPVVARIGGGFELGLGRVRLRYTRFGVERAREQD